MAKIPLHFILNGEERAEFVDSGATLLRLLRDKTGDLTAKSGCLQGTCGTCTVLVDGAPRLSCITLAEDCDGADVETVAGLAAHGQLHPLQHAVMEHFAAQCGFCTPGMLMAAKALFLTNPRPSREDVVEALSGNICRCTGYEPIIQAVLSAAQVMSASGPGAA
ncbi:(2Fe-2S)-binding protein [Ancylobacter sonchi]|uniref:(2Fe-2S)-binding protein n=1 Tax=Ancylobacter sonchi TaxID=1937790 RepID=UPI001BD3A1E6|nr:(2Fe-2S)-binding protein [Ancylobacter sonchi]MBS7533426.1 (2Fe-2S)-binding protein [Ancylobacter sonchi]